jgi:hypothetical protein
MSASYIHFVKQYQKRLSLTSKQLNRLDRKHNNINLIKKLQQLYPNVAANTGFYGTFTIGNQKAGFSTPRYIEIKLEYNNINIVTQIINSETTEVLTIPIGSRLPLPSSILQVKTRIEGPPGVSGVELTNLSGFTSFEVVTGNDPTENNIIEAVIDSGFINGGNLTLDFIIDTT